MAAFKAAIMLIGLIKTDDITYVGNFITGFLIYYVTQYLVSGNRVPGHGRGIYGWSEDYTLRIQAWSMNRKDWISYLIT